MRPTSAPILNQKWGVVPVGLPKDLVSSAPRQERFLDSVLLRTTPLGMTGVGIAADGSFEKSSRRRWMSRIGSRAFNGAGCLFGLDTVWASPNSREAEGAILRQAQAGARPAQYDAMQLP